MWSLRSLPRRAAALLIASTPVNYVVRGAARLRGRALILIYHRVGPPLPAGCEIVPTVAIDTFRHHLHTLRELVDFVPLERIISADAGALPLGSGARPPVAVTFDDDLPSHVQHALPILRELGIPATFFLSGRALHGLGPYWFQWLETLLVNRGPRQTAALLKVSDAAPHSLLLAAAANAELRRRVCEVAAALPIPELLDREGIAALASAAMTVGFHTVDHDMLPGLDEAGLHDAVSRGRRDLAALTGQPVQFFAYPFGRSDHRCAAAVRQAGFLAAFTGRPAPWQRAVHRYDVGRWEPGAIRVEDLVAKLAVRLHRASPVKRALRP
jgi:peptidoglycan/xylan/chitin deacetylase (PgdA/CDA1 family)